VSHRISRALVTGASAGLGEGFARALAARGVELVLVARRQDRLEALAAQLPVACEVLPADLTDDAELAAVEARLRATSAPVDLLVNNAGFGAYGAFVDLPPERQTEMVACNVTAMVRCTHAVLAQLRPRGRGGVINVGSTAGFQPDPWAAVYGGTKAFVRSFTEALHEELRGTGVRVMLLAPGVTATEFQQVAGVHVDRAVAAVSMPVEPVVERALTDLARGRAVSVPGAVNRLGALGADLTPSALSRRVSGLVHERFAGRA
jgi:short-subunit dehydrogenase